MILLPTRSLTKPVGNRRWVAVAAFGLAYFAFCRLSLAFCVETDGVAGIWPPAGVALAAMLVLGRFHRVATLVAIGTAHAAATLMSPRPVELGLALVLPNLLAAVVGEWVYRRLAGRSIRLDTLRRAAVLVLAVAPIGAAVGALGGAIIFRVLVDDSLWLTFRSWWIADNLGILSTAPVLLLAVRNPHRRERSAYYVEAGIIFSVGLALAVWIFSVSSLSEVYDLRRPYMLIVVHAWAALRLRGRHAAALAMVTCFVVIGFTTNGRGLFAISHLTEFEQLLDAELYLTVVTSTSLLISALGSERQRQQRRLMRAAIARAEFDRLQHLRLVTDTIPVFVSYIGPDGRYQFNSRHYESISPVPHEQIVGRTVREIVGENNYRQVAPHLRQALAGRRVRFEYEFVSPDGSTKNLLIDYLPHFDASGAQCGLYCLATDVTQQKAVEEQLRQYQQRLEQAARLTTMGELAGGLAHELNQPLSAIHNYARGCARRLQAASPDLSELKTALDQISLEASRAGHIIAGLRRHFSRRSLERKPVVLERMIERVLEISQYELRRCDISAKVSASAVPAVLIDAVQIEQVLLNLVRNACEAVRETSGPRELVIDVELLSDEQIMVSVIDSGVGFSPEAEARLFETFYTTKDDGLGMGLPISRSIIEAHGGRLWAECNSDQGATFRFTLPLEC